MALNLEVIMLSVYLRKEGLLKVSTGEAELVPRLAEFRPIDGGARKIDSVYQWKEPVRVRSEFGVASAGVVGAAVAGRLLEAGRSISFFDVRPEAAPDLVTLGARLATVPEELADCAVVLLALDSEETVEQVVFGPRGVGCGGAANRLVVDLSPGTPERTKEFAKRAARAGLRWVDAPLPIKDFGVKLPLVSLRLGGEAADVDQAERLLEPLAWRRVHAGRLGNAQAGRLIDCLVRGCSAALAVEVAALAGSAGFAEEDVHFLSGLDNVVMAAPRHAEELTEMLDAVRAFGSALGVPLPLASAAAEACRGRLDADGDPAE